MAEGDERVRVLYSGTVQGVGFRWRAVRCASGLGLRGFVRNLPDGTVELVAEGPRARVESLLAAVREAMGDLIEDESATRTPARGGLPEFGIAR